MSTKKDLTKSSLAAEDDTRVVLVHDGDEITVPILSTAFVNGQELLLSAESPITLSGGTDDLFQVTLTIIPTSIELISKTEMEARLLKES